MSKFFWLEQHDFRFSVRYRSMLDASRDDEELAGMEVDDLISKLHPKRASDDQKHLVFVGMGVPHELALNLDQLDQLTVELAHDLGEPAVFEQTEFLGEIDLFHAIRTRSRTPR